MIAVANDRLFAKFAQAIGRAEWADDPRFRTSADRLAHKDFLVAEIRSTLRAETKEQWMEKLEASGIPCAPILTIPEVLAQPQTQALGIFQNMQEIGVDLLNLPFAFDGMRATLNKRAPSIGEHNEEIFKK
jgi:crotonobetainyl-CoA:carnitine CoA-transferase CaiB-like acyl-CoA transferase